MDTNAFISAALKPGGLVNRKVAYILEDGILLTSDTLLEEYRTRLEQPKFDRYVTHRERRRILEAVSLRGERTHVHSMVDASEHPDDNAVLALAVDGRANFIVTRDKKNLLPLHPFRGIPILSPRDFAERFELG